MKYEQIAMLIGQVIDRGSISSEEQQALEMAREIVLEKPNTRTIAEVQSIIDCVRAGIPVQIEYYDPEINNMGGYDYVHLPVY